MSGELLEGGLWALLVAPLTEFGFMRRALVGCLALSLGCAPVGVFLLLRRMSLTGDAMAHAILPGAATKTISLKVPSLFFTFTDIMMAP